MEWLLDNWIELIASLFGVVYVLLALKQSVWCWPAGIINVGLYIFVFYQARLFGDVALQAFYLLISFYGWYNWIFGRSEGQATLPVIRLERSTGMVLLVITVSGSILFGYILSLSSSSIPYWDGATTALGLAGTWMIARKYLENWLVWIFTDLLCTGIYLYKELYLTAGLYLLLAFVAVAAWFEWKKRYYEVN